MTSEFLTLVDCHVHVHPQFDPARLLNAAAANFKAAAARINADSPWSGMLLLTEMSGVGWFEATRSQAVLGDAGVGNWRLSATAEPEILVATQPQSAVRLTIVSGRQAETSERIEVLALATCEAIADGLPLDETVAACHAAGALVVLPWGVGKWLGSRGERVIQVLQNHESRLPVLAGDNAGRPWFWPRPRIFAQLEAQGRPVLVGTDPLPLADQASRAGSYGMALNGAIAEVAVVANLKSRFLDTWNPQLMRPFGRLERAPDS